MCELFGEFSPRPLPFWERGELYRTFGITYTRGSDMSGSLEGSGGMGGLLARTGFCCLDGLAEKLKDWIPQPEPVVAGSA